MEKKEEEEKNVETHICNNPDCKNEGKLRSPNCHKLGIKKESYFCGKECFKSYWTEHRKIHELCKIKLYNLIIF